jgi:hypothetical protein
VLLTCRLSLTMRYVTQIYFLRRDRKSTSVLQNILEAVSRSNVTTEHLTGCNTEEHAKVNARYISRLQWSSRLQ